MEITEQFSEFEGLLDPECKVGLDMLPDDMISTIGDDPAVARVTAAEQFAAMAGFLPPTEVAIEERLIPGPDGDVPVAIYQPPNPAPRPGLLWIHGGGYLVGTGRDDLMAIPFAEGAGCTVVSVDYRLAPEHPFPAGPEDCYAALLWMVEHADELGIDVDRIAMGGNSAGGGMTAGVALMSRDRGGPQLALQLLLYPMIDDTHDTPSGRYVTHPKVWNREVSDKAWKMYLGDSYGDNVSPYAAATRADDLSGLPPAYICVGTMDLFRDEDIDFAKRLMDAGVPTELVVYPGGFHGFEIMAPMAELSQRMRADYVGALARALA